MNTDRLGNYGVWRAAITLPEEVHSPIAKAVFDELVERGLAPR